MVVALSEASYRDPNTVNGRELVQMSELARLLGYKVIEVPHDLSEFETPEAIFDYTPNFDPPAPALWLGYVPTVAHYSELYQAASSKGIYLLNSPQQYQTAMEFDQFYPLLEGLTPKSAWAESVEDLHQAAQRIGYPVFLKGTIKSNKEEGWSACVAYSDEDLGRIASDLLGKPGRSRGRVIVRELVNLRKIPTEYSEFPLGREYRLFVLNQEIVAWGFYWEEQTAIPLEGAERLQVFALAQEASRRLGVPFLSVDVGQLESGEWMVIEVGDGQFSGLSQVQPMQLLNGLLQILETQNQI